MKLQRKVTSLLILFTSAFVLATGTVEYVNHLRFETEEIFEDYLSDARSLAASLERLFRQEARQLKAVGTSVLVRRALKASNDQFAAMTPDKRDAEIDRNNREWMAASAGDPIIRTYLTNDVANYFRSYQSEFPFSYAEMFLTNRYGALVGSSNRLTTYAHGAKYWWKSGWSDGAGKVTFDDRGFDLSAGDYVVGVVIPVRVEGEVVGILKGNVPVVKSLERLVENQNLPSQVDVAIVRASGEVVIGNKMKPLQHSVSPTLMKSIVTQESGAIIDETDTPRLVAFAPVAFTLNKGNLAFTGGKRAVDQRQGGGGSAWYVVISEPKEVAYQSIYDEVNDHWVIILLFSLPMALLAYFFARIIVSPMKTLEEYAGQVAKGELASPPFLDRADEIGTLARTLDGMVANLRKMTASRNELNAEIENRKLVEEELDDSVRKYRSLFENMRDGYVYGKMWYAPTGEPVDWTYLEVNQPFETMTGLQRSDILGHKASHVESQFAGDERILNAFGKVAASGESTAFEYCDVSRGLWFALSVYRPQRGYFVAVFDNITDRKRAELQVADEKDRAKRYLDVARVMLVALNRYGDITLLNQHGCALLEVTEEEALGANWFDRFIPEENREMVRGEFGRLMSGAAVVTEYYEDELLTGKGEKRLFGFHNTLLRDSVGGVIGTLSSGELRSNGSDGK